MPRPDDGGPKSLGRGPRCALVCLPVCAGSSSPTHINVIRMALSAHTATARRKRHAARARADPCRSNSRTRGLGRGTAGIRRRRGFTKRVGGSAAEGHAARRLNQRRGRPSWSPSGERCGLDGQVGGSMAWWTWLLVGWAVASLLFALLLGAAARVSRQRDPQADSDTVLLAEDQPEPTAVPTPRDADVSEGSREAPGPRTRRRSG